MGMTLSLGRMCFGAGVEYQVRILVVLALPFPRDVRYRSSTRKSLHKET